MRIVHGEHSGRRIHLPKSLRARPTTDQAREALFNILVNRFDFEELEVLDLFSGTGSISYEFASLGCKHIVSVDIDRFHVAAIQKNFDTLEFNNVMVIRSDVFRFIKQSSIKCNLIFADPPFDLPDFASIPDKIIQSDLLKPEGLLILEHGPKYSFENHVNFTELRKYGKVRFSFFSI
ncbi:MAG: methyltransferase domain-containing protein [Bacteroidetes bacterium]|nr:methyltransferase domain-containing protein [Bacteroidota bacterium]MBT3747697.1 methyltransferase domain-containing protein [Bacteroidota bacterium]MBT4398447.1 methyltransferase domain-containing protein [Bacteroidota bacterium]MBT4411956.1 methyltransferase domain-containing protein [Bacteroidota bacterium]MBT5427772.1 methyltransferase domain-containing protein [Bacteroidota bacterium]